MTLDRGQTLGLVGETGAGKTTIAKAILRLLPDPPSRITGGQVWFDDTDLLSLPEDEMRAFRGDHIAMIFQDPMTALNPIMNVGSQIAEGLRVNKCLSAREAREKAMAMLELVGIPKERYFEYPHQFSGGMKQRVVIALALACDPQLLIADEPTTALDVTIQAQILELIKELQKNKNTAMIMITHDFGIIAETADIVAVIYAGQIIEFGTKQQIWDEPMHPYTRALFKAIPSMKKVDRLVPIEGVPVDPSVLPTGCSFCARCTENLPECADKKFPCTISPTGIAAAVSRLLQRRSRVRRSGDRKNWSPWREPRGKKQSKDVKKSAELKSEVRVCPHYWKSKI